MPRLATAVLAMGLLGCETQDADATDGTVAAADTEHESGHGQEGEEGDGGDPGDVCEDDTQDQEHRALVESFYEVVLAEHDLDAAADFIRSDYIQHNPFVEPGLDGFVEYFGGFFAAAPDTGVELLDIGVEGDRVFVHTTFRGTYDGPFAGVEVDSRPFEFNTMDIFRIEDGMLVEHWDVVDTYTLFLQLGLLQ